jgi:DNA-binding CsgD family transcriptional regulator
MPLTIGREFERAAVERLLDGGSARLTALVLEGEAGIGKTTVWRDAVHLARERGYAILTCRPSQAETTLAFASLADLLEPIDDLTIAKLPGPQGRALGVALLRAGPHALATQGRAVAAGVVSLMRELARSQPVLLGIDDVQWLDPSSSAALSFALRRLGDERLAVVVSRRSDESNNPGDVLGLDGEFPDRVERVRLGPLNLGALYHLLRSHLGATYPRPMLQRIERASGGNPLYAIELARAYQALDRAPGPGEPLPMGRLADLIGVRIAALPVSTRQALLAVASLADATDAAVELALGEKGLVALGRGVGAGLIERADGRVRFAHPLYAGGVLSAASRGDREAMHQRLADAVDDPEERARHLALASDGPDEGVAAELESAAQRVAKRGAPGAGSELLELAVRKTPPSDPNGAARRRVDLVELTLRAGDTDEAKRQVALVLDAVPTGSLRARALEQRARINFIAGTGNAALVACDEALRQPDLPLELRARIHATRSNIGKEDIATAERDALIALELLEQVEAPDPVVEVQAISARIGAMLHQGLPLPVDLVEQGLAVEALAPNPVVSDRISSGLGSVLKYLGDFAAARYWLEHTHRAAIEEGDEGSMPYAVSHLPQLELWSGNWQAAERWALEHMDLAERTGQVSQRRQAIYNLAQVHAHLGRVEEAAREAEEALAEATAEDSVWEIWTLSAVLGFTALSVGDLEAAVTHLGRSVAVGDKMGDAEPGRQIGDYAEALVAVGRLEEAAPMAETYVSRATAAGNAMLLPNALRARAIVAAAEQRLEDAATAVEEALVEHRRVDVPFDRARTLLAAGQIRRRIGERRAARAALQEARDIFGLLGSPLWEQRAEQELRRIPIRRSAGGELTEAEARVAALAADGRSNREIARALFVSVKTVEANLSRVYAKFGVRSRAGLANRMTDRTSEAAAPKV